MNGHGEILFNALPVADIDNTSSGRRLIFPHVIDGGGISTPILLMNPSGSGTGRGSISIFDDTGAPVSMDFGGGLGSKSTLDYSIAANGMVKISTRGVGALKAGYIVVTVDSGPVPVGSGIFLAGAGGGLSSQAGVPTAPETTSAKLFVEISSIPLNRNTGIALVNRNNQTANVTLSLVGIDGGAQHRRCDSRPIRTPPNSSTSFFRDCLRTCKAC